MEVFIGFCVVVFIIYRLNKVGKNRWKKSAAEFLIHIPVSEYSDVSTEMSLLTSQHVGIQSSLAIAYIHVVSTLIVSSTKPNASARDKRNVLSIIQDDFGLGQLFYKKYVEMIHSIGMKGIGSFPIDFHEFSAHIAKSIIGITNAK